MPLGGATILATDKRGPGYFCRATQSTAQTGIVTSTPTTITFDGTDAVDSLSIHDPMTNNSRFVIGVKLGWWQVFATIPWLASTVLTNSTYAAQVIVNGTVVAAGSRVNRHSAVSAQAISSHTFATVQATLATDYVEIQGFHDAGSDNSTFIGTVSRPAVSLIYLGT